MAHLFLVCVDGVSFKVENTVTTWGGGGSDWLLDLFASLTTPTI
jgi:hypothetical protein